MVFVSLDGGKPGRLPVLMAARVAEEVVVAFCDGESMYRFSTTICVKYEIDLPAQFDVR